MKVQFWKNLYKPLLMCGLMFIITMGIIWGAFTVHSSSEIPSSDKIEILSSADTFVASGHPEAQYGTFRLIWVGYNNQGFNIERALFQFDGSQIPAGSQIVSATLSLYASVSDQANASMTVQIDRIQDEWSENITWNIQQNLKIAADSPTTITVIPNAGWQTWNITTLVQNWWGASQHGRYFSIRLRGNETPGQHERPFWSKDCDISASCGGKQPKLVIAYNPPPTVTPTPTNTPPPTPTPTATPGIASLTLTTNQPGGTIPQNTNLTYVIQYANGPTDSLANVSISNQIPQQTELVTYTVPTEQDIQITKTGSKGGDTIFWTFPHGMEINHNSHVDYTVRRSEGSSRDTIINNGAQITWVYGGVSHSLLSNPTFNPSQYVYLPLVIK